MRGVEIAFPGILDRRAIIHIMIHTHTHLMSPADQIQVVPVEKLCYNVRPECEGHSAIVLSPSLQVLVRVGPEEVAEEPRVGDVCRSRYRPDLLEVMQIRGETCVGMCVFVCAWVREQTEVV